MCVLLVVLPTAATLAQPDAARARAATALDEGEFDEALAIAGKVVEENPGEIWALDLLARVNESDGNFEEALASYDRLVELEPALRSYLGRGQARFKAGQIEGALEDFDRVVELDPRSEPQLWQRGIAQYYAGRFRECRAQFESHLTVNAADVENAAWHFLCVAALEGVEKARISLLPVGTDRRQPMSTIYDLYRGKASPEDVLEAAGDDTGGPSDARFFAHLYVGLYYDALGENDKGRSHLETAAELPFPHYMIHVARVHVALLEAREEK